MSFRVVHLSGSLIAQSKGDQKERGRLALHSFDPDRACCGTPQISTTALPKVWTLSSMS